MGRTRRPVRSVFSALVLAGGLALVACHPVKPGPAPGPEPVHVPCSVPALVNAINTADSTGGAALTLAANCNYRLTGPHNLGNGLPVITAPIGIVGGPNTSITGNNTTFRILEVASSGRLDLQGVSISSGGPGGILNGGNLLLDHATVHNNSGPGIVNTSPASAQLSSSLVTTNTTTSSSGPVGGGGIVNSGSLTLVQSVVRSNVVTATGSNAAQGGGIQNLAGGVLRLFETTVSGNQATGGDAQGGGIFNAGSLTGDRTLVERNVATAPAAAAAASSTAPARPSSIAPSCGTTNPTTAARPAACRDVPTESTAVPRRGDGRRRPRWARG